MPAAGGGGKGSTEHMAKAEGGRRGEREKTQRHTDRQTERESGSASSGSLAKRLLSAQTSADRTHLSCISLVLRDNTEDLEGGDLLPLRRQQTKQTKVIGWRCKC